MRFCCIFQTVSVLATILARTLSLVAADTPTSGSISNPALRTLAPGKFQYGHILIDKSSSAIHFPAELNMTNGLLEYLLVTQSGKTHESLLSTAIDPVQLNTALLLLTTNRPPTNSTPLGASTNAPPINDPSPIKLAGPRVYITLTWTNGFIPHTLSAEKLLLNVQKPLAQGLWIYNGSRFADTKFMAQVTGSIISLITDPDAMINNQAPGHDNDEAWTLETTNSLPPLKTPVQVQVSFKQP